MSGTETCGVKSVLGMNLGGDGSLIPAGLGRVA